ncbi:MAG: hypothetical protein GW909_02510 [Sphingomonadales bacterium]|nr:hypothetical protein [Sphingomonadales bacterium]
MGLLLSLFDETGSGQLPGRGSELLFLSAIRSPSTMRCGALAGYWRRQTKLLKRRRQKQRITNFEDYVT